MLLGFQVGMCVVVCFRWQCVLLGLLGSNVCCCMFQMEMCVVVCSRWQSVLMGHLEGKMSCWVF